MQLLRERARRIGVHDMITTCVACGDTGLNSRGFPCWICVQAGRVKREQANTGRRLVKNAGDPIEELIFATRHEIARQERLLAAETSEQRVSAAELAERERRAAEDERRRLLEEISRLEGGET